MNERMTGVITRMIPNRGFGFIRGTDHRSYFMHCRNVLPNEAAFDLLHEGQKVEFLATDSGPDNTLRAKEVTAC